ncbi:Zinc finger, C3HC4 type (RING finger) [Musa troglodytarum]|uniref:Protein DETOXIFICATION n=1 Tax=Musa troglodytarum TaxID=320322 RepID=A0A9E7F9P8_9LILI|nr:Zinc finger, C3HC4 type (RING finger) [Musa troglodytarum]
MVQNVPAPYGVEENFGGYFHDHDDPALAEDLQNQESIYLSFQGNVHGGSSRLNNGHDRNMVEGYSSRMARVEQQLALDEALARELQESENQLADTSFGEVTRIEANITPAQSFTASAERSSASTSSQELQQWGETIGYVLISIALSGVSRASCFFLYLPAMQDFRLELKWHAQYAMSRFLALEWMHMRAAGEQQTKTSRALHQPSSRMEWDYRREYHRAKTATAKDVYLWQQHADKQLIVCSSSNKRRFMAATLRDDSKTRSHPYPSRRQAPSNHRFALLVSRLQQAVTISHHTMSSKVWPATFHGVEARDNPLRGPSIGKRYCIFNEPTMFVPDNPSSASPYRCDHHHNPHGFLTVPFVVDVQKPLTTVPPVLQPKPPNSVTLALIEAKSILSLALPMVLTGLLLYSRSMISMLFLGRLGDLPLAGGALAIGFANITGYSVLSGLAMGMEPICGQAFGAQRHRLLGLALHRTVLLLLFASLPIALLWFYIRPILLLLGQDPALAAAASAYLHASLPDLLLQSFLHPLRIYLRTQSITLPLTACAAISVTLHLPISYLLVSVLRLGIGGVALASVWTNVNLVLFLVAYIYLSDLHRSTGGLSFSTECFGEWRPLLNLAVPSCVSVCLEWWWYEIMIILCGLLLNPQATVASMGILIQTTSLIYIFPSSLSFGVSTRVGNELGANRPDRARRAATVGLSCSFVLGLLAFCFSVSVRHAWATMFTADSAILGLTSSVLPILGLCEFGNCPQTTGCGVLRGSARPRVGANVNLGSFYAVGMPVAVGLAFFTGLDFKGLWLGLLAAQTTCVLLMLLVIKSTDWSTQAERAQQLTGAASGVVDDALPSPPQKGMPVDHVDETGSLTIKIEQPSS